MRALTVLGATGTVGRHTLDVVAGSPERWRVHALAAHRDVAGMVELCRRHRPARAVMADPDAAEALRSALDGLPVRVEGGPQALERLGGDGEADAVMAAIVGAAGLAPTMAAIRAGRRVLLANKESMVMAGELMMRAVAEHDALLLPIDSEHNGVFQCLKGDYRCGRRPEGVRRVVLTASGGPFRTWPAERIARATVQEALQHPNWQMGPKITVDSATLMNKGLELIEARWLFALEPEALGVVVHPQSLVHALVEYEDGSTLAHLGRPDMRVPIAHALAWPERMASGVASLSLIEAGTLHFEAPDEQTFPALALARRAMQMGGVAPAALNAANEVAVQAFLDGRIRLPRIVEVVRGVLDEVERGAWPPADSLEGVLAADQRARELARDALEAVHG